MDSFLNRIIRAAARDESGLPDPENGGDAVGALNAVVEDVSCGQRQRPRVNSALALAAALLDATGSTPDDLRRGCNFVVVPQYRVGIVEKALSNAFPDIARGGGCDFGPDSFLVLDGVGSTWRLAYDSGATIVTVVGADDRDDDKVVRVMRVADRIVEVGHVAGRPDVVARVVEAVTGDAVEVTAAAAEHLSWDDVAFGCRPGMTGAEALAKILRLRDARIVVPQEPPKEKADEVKEKSEPAVARLSELSGFGEAREWGLRLAEDIAAYKRGELEWVDVDKGVLLAGAPGVGKTFFARSLAAECNVPLVMSSYSEMEAQTGSGNLIAKAIKKIFDGARKKAPCVLFIDEMDSVGVRQRRAHNSGWFDVVINALLAELDGTNPRDGVVVVGATNHADNVDPALKRPGRLDRTITIPMPTIAELKGIVAHHMGIDSVVAARAVRGRTPAQIAMDCRDARRLARRERRNPTVDDLVAVVAAGREVLDAEREWRMAIHESGHACWIMRQTSERLDHVDLDALYTKSRSIEAGVAAEILALISSCLAGRAAEQAILGEPGTGAVVDLDQATRLALAYHARMGFGQRGLASYEKDAVDAALHDAVSRTLDDCYDTTVAWCRSARAGIERVARALVDSRYLDADEVKAAFFASPLFEREDELDPPEIPQWCTAKHKGSPVRWKPLH
ncbi:AAA family ATPase [Rhodoblastus sp.]|uniref:AAA family ATPase n=1 Tax=Rhodoblastus sp. TaxID=1962975 RepID=UPI003F9E81AB